jgi:hypothetical protein
MTTRKPDTGRDSAEHEQSDSPQRAKRKAAEPQLYIKFLPEGKGGPKVNKGAVPLEVDVEAHIEERTDCEPGLYRIEKKRNGEFSGEILWYTKDDEETSVNHNRGDSGEFGSPQFDAEEITGQSEGLSAAEAIKLFSAMLDERERRARATQSQPGALDILREVEEMTAKRIEQDRQQRQAIREEIAAMMPKENPVEREPEMDDRTRLELAAVRQTGIIPEIFRTMREMVSTADRANEPQSWTEWFRDVLRDVAPVALPMVAPYVAPTVGRMLSNVAEHVDPAALAGKINAQQPPTPEQFSVPPAMPQAMQPLPTAAPPVATPSENEAADDKLDLAGLVQNIKADILGGKTPKESIDDVVRFCAENPDMMPHVVELLDQSNAILIAAISNATGTNLSIIANADKFATGLKDGVRKRLAPVQAAPASTNGNGSYAAASAAEV